MPNLLLILGRTFGPAAISPVLIEVTEVFARQAVLANGRVRLGRRWSFRLAAEPHSDSRQTFRMERDRSLGPTLLLELDR